MMRAGDIVVLRAEGRLYQGTRDADTEDSRGFGVLLDQQAEPGVLGGTRVLFEDEGIRWTRGTIDSPAARALLTVASLRSPDDDVVICSECGERMHHPYDSCPTCGAIFP